MKYVYKIVSGGVVLDNDQFNRHGHEGWELVTVLEHRPHYQLILKRPVPGPPDAVQKIRDHVEMLMKRHDGPGHETGRDACAGILHFINNELDA
jgi:hypothetical protein